MMLFCSLMSTVEAYWVWPIFCKVSLQAFFFGSVVLYGETWAPKKWQFFLWLTAHGRCWTADWLAKKGLPHLSHCPLCNQEEIIWHILIGCVFSKQVWILLLQRVGLSPSPQARYVALSDCCLRINDFIWGSMKLGLNSVLDAWTLGCCGNTAMISFFNGASPNVQQILRFILEEGELWCLVELGG